MHKTVLFCMLWDLNVSNLNVLLMLVHWCHALPVCSIIVHRPDSDEVSQLGQFEFMSCVSKYTHALVGL